jgi:hypothetical protein
MAPPQSKRLELHALLVAIAGEGHVYFQPPPTVEMVYPCVVYNLDNAHTDFADNVPYRNKDRYQVTAIDPDPDGDLRKKVAALPSCLFNRFFTADQLNHFVFNLFF